MSSNTAKQGRLGLSRFFVFGRSWGFKIHFLRNIVHSLKSFVFQQVGCARNTLQFHTVQLNPKSFFWPKLRRLKSCSRFMGSDVSVFVNTFRPKDRGDPLSMTKIKRFQGMTNVLKNIVFHQTSIFAPSSFVVCVWGQWSSDQDDHQRKKSHNETCFQDPQNCAWLVVRSN